MTAVLKVEGLGKSFGGLRALNDLDLEVGAGKVRGLIGPNGSGKTTTVNILTGLFPASTGRVWLDGVDITGQKPNRIVRAGMARTFQNLRLFAERSVIDNIRAGQHVHATSLAARFSALTNRQERQLRQEAEALAARFGLEHRCDWHAGALSYGEKKRLEIARALASKPRILLLDEPAAGMNPAEIEWLVAAIRELRDTGTAVLLIEHHMKLVMTLCDDITVLNFGSRIAEGPPSAISVNPLVIEAYLGKAREHA